jgi:hypothetical protein
VLPASLLRPLHRTVRPVRGRPGVAAVLVEPARELGVARADLQQVDALGACDVREQLLYEVEVPADCSQDVMRAEQPVRCAELRERTGEVICNFPGVR